jgi:outer membrane protein OmpA-like peptidoglycan-associated protein
MRMGLSRRLRLALPPGIPDARLTVLVHGDEPPIAARDDDACHVWNRRVEIFPR